jgi:hypothetical protein
MRVLDLKRQAPPSVRMKGSWREPTSRQPSHSYLLFRSCSMIRTRRYTISNVTKKAVIQSTSMLPPVTRADCSAAFTQRGCAAPRLVSASGLPSQRRSFGLVAAFHYALNRLPG